MNQAGFKILDFPPGGLTNWKPVHPFDYTIESHEACPIDGTPFATIAAIVSLSTDERIRVGCCPTCGLVGYIDRPSAADIDRYYAETWMGESVEACMDKAKFLRDSTTTGGGYERFDTTKPVLEIGCGYGNTIAKLRAAGFRVIHATESCPARAEAVRRTFDIQVTADMPEVEYGLIVSHHVLEHVAEPMGLLRACAARQADGGRLYFTMPAFGAEPSIGVLMFLPHLWSFTAFTLGRAMHAAGYSYVGRVAGMQLTAEAVWPCGPGVIGSSGESLVPFAISKLLHGLGLSRGGPHVLTWQRDFDGATWKPAAYAQNEAAHGFPRTMVVEPVGAFRSDAPIEIQFEGRIQLFHK